MPWFKQRLPVVEAIQWDGQPATELAILDFINAQGIDRGRTLRQLLGRIEVGDWVVRDRSTRQTTVYKDAEFTVNWEPTEAPVGPRKT